jgi:hypothetical protein
MSDCFRNTRRCPDIHIQEVNIAFEPIVKLNENGIGNRMNFDKTCRETHLGCRAEIWTHDDRLQREQNLRNVVQTELRRNDYFIEFSTEGAC